MHPAISTDQSLDLLQKGTSPLYITTCLDKPGCCMQGSIPDMWATTELYLAVQRLYRDKAEADASAVAAHLARRLSSAERDPGSIPPKTLRTFVKHAHCLRHAHLCSRDVLGCVRSKGRNACSAGLPKR